MCLYVFMCFMCVLRHSITAFYVCVAVNGVLNSNNKKYV